MNQSNNFEDSSNPVSPTRPQVRTMGEIMEMKKKWDSTVQSQHCSSSPSEHQTYHSPSRPQTRSQLHLASSSQVQHSPSRPQTRSQQQLQFSPSRPGIRSQQQLHSSPSRPGTRSQQQLHSFPIPDDGDDGTKKGPMIVKKGRGCAQFPKGWGTGKKLEVTLDSKGRVIGPDVNHYKTAIGSKSVVLADLKDIWRRWKHEIKVKYFLPHIDDLEFLSQSPTERVEQDQWKELVTYWKDEDVQKIARKNAINVSKKQCLHRTGRTSFAILKQEMMMKGTDPSTLDVWLESRSRGKGFEDDDTLDLHVNIALIKRNSTTTEVSCVSYTLDRPRDAPQSIKSPRTHCSRKLFTNDQISSLRNNYPDYLLSRA
ncbi:UNVERIFIED_CONTAM: hypothetical protein Sradi_3620600 [Sesamum radiatum]|uniref:Transposase n=1 Tax=Sesamum radiatum TaxID=300843 RepID=A0AAW2QHS8_SESRA